MALEPLIINAPRQGIAQSPHIGFGDCRNLDISSLPGIARLNNILALKSSPTDYIKWFARDPVTIANIYALDNDGVVYKSTNTGGTWAAVTGNAFTVTIASPAVFTSTAHGMVLNDTVVFATTGALPTGLTAGTTYYVITAGLTADAYEVSTSEGGSAVNTSGTQSGTHTFRPTLGASGNGLEIWKGYVFVARNARLDVYSGTTWTNNWQTIDTDSDWHPMIVSKNDGKIYGGAGRYVFSIEENSGQTFAPGTVATYTFTAQALDLPASYKIKCIEELGNNLILGTWQGSAVNSIRIADIFPWDRSSTSFGQPIILAEYGIHAIKNIGNSLVVLAGTNGTIYKCDGANAYIIGQLPIDLSGGKYLEWYPGSICHYKNKVFFGSGSPSATTIGGQGVYSLEQTGRGNILNLEHLPSTLTDGSAASVQITALLPVSRDTLLVGWRSGDT